MRTDVSEEVERIFQEHVERFLAWAAKHWTVNPKDRKDEVFGQLSDDYVEGYNAGIASVADAFKCWTEDGEP
jgi:hypothetical protein